MDFVDLPETDKAYLAGILDGEGYIHIYARKVKYGKSCRPQFAITSTSTKWLSDLRDKWSSAGNFCIMKNRKSAKWKPYAQWTVTGPIAQKILIEVYPYLQMKQDRAWLVINFKTVGQGKRRSPEEMKIQEQIYFQVRELNQRGVVVH